MAEKADAVRNSLLPILCIETNNVIDVGIAIAIVHSFSLLECSVSHDSDLCSVIMPGVCCFYTKKEITLDCINTYNQGLSLFVLII